MTKPLQDILFECLARPEAEWADAVAAAGRDHPHWAQALQQRFAELNAFGLVAAQDPTPRQVGGYELLHPLGGGAMGTVFLARSVAQPTELLAVKLLQPGLSFSGAAQARFAREREIVGKLRHAGLCVVRESGVADGVPFLAMEYIEGEDLSRRIQRGARSGAPPDAAESNRIVALMAKVARALQVAHDAGLIHRDIKPGNIIVRAADDQPVLLDFGLARELEEAGARLTGSGAWVGSPAYLAPEAISGHRPLDARADVYAMGVTLFECLSYHLPYHAPTREALFHGILHARVPDLRRLHPAISTELALVTRVAMAKSPEQRYASAAALADDLEAILGGQPIAIRGPSWFARGLGLVRRRPVFAALAAVLVLALGVTVWSLRELSQGVDRLRALGLANLAATADPESAVLLSRRAVELLKHPVTVSELQAAVARYHPRIDTAPGPGIVQWCSYLPDEAGTMALFYGGLLQVFDPSAASLAEIEDVVDAVALGPRPDRHPPSPRASRSGIAIWACGNGVHRRCTPCAASLESCGRWSSGRTGVGSCAARRVPRSKIPCSPPAIGTRLTWQRARRWSS